jgi:hypothetical protein
MTSSTANKYFGDQGTGQNLIPLSSVAASSVLVGQECSVANFFSGMCHIHFARTTSSAPATGVSFLIEACAESTTSISSNVASQWYPIGTYVTGVTAAVLGTVTATSSNVLTASGASSYAVQTVCMVSGVSSGWSDANTEWYRVNKATSSAITAYEPFKNSYSSGSSYSQAEIASLPLDLSAVGRLRITADGSAHSQPFLTEVWLVSLYSITNQ